MAQALVVTLLNGNPNLDTWAGGIKKHSGPLALKLDWQSAADGSVSFNIASTYAAAQVGLVPKPTKIRGYLRRVVCDPDASSTQPSAAYDVYIKDSGAIALSGTSLENRSQSANDEWVPTTNIWVDDELSLVIANAGDTKGGLVYLYFTPE